MKRQVVIVTGDRNWTDVNAIACRLSRYPDRSILIHGDCKTGADMLADEWAREHWWHMLPVPYFQSDDSDDNRNALMIHIGSAFVATERRRLLYDVTVEAFPPTESRPSGTRNCMRLAREAGLPVFEKERP